MSFLPALFSILHSHTLLVRCILSYEPRISTTQLFFRYALPLIFSLTRTLQLTFLVPHCVQPGDCALALCILQLHYIAFVLLLHSHTSSFCSSHHCGRQHSFMELFLNINNDTLVIIVFQCIRCLGVVNKAHHR